MQNEKRAHRKRLNRKRVWEYEMLRFSGCLIVGSVCAVVLGCGVAGPNCTNPLMSITPQTAALDSTAASPANSLRFSLSYTYSDARCAAPTVIVIPTNWAASDSTDVSISNATDQTNGVATCLHATKAPVTISLAGSTVTAAQLTCK